MDNTVLNDNNSHPFFGARVNGKEAAIGLILMFPCYLYVIPMIANFLIYLYVRSFGYSDGTTLNVMLNVIVDVSCLIMIVLIMKDFFLESLRVFKQNLVKNLLWSCTIGYGITFAISIAANVLITMLVGTGDNQATNQVLLDSMLRNHIPEMLITTCICAPILEELLFRGLIYSTLREKNIVLAHLVSAFLFGFLHIYSAIMAGDSSQWIYLLSYGGMGFAFSLGYELRGNICTPMLMHAMNNIIAMAISISQL